MNFRIELPKKIIPAYTSKKRFIILYGGRSSGKSHSVARILLLKALEKKCLILCTRQIQKSIAASSYSLLVKIINEYNLNEYFEILLNEIRCLRNGSKFIFQGLWQNLDNIKSLEGVQYCWLEESHSVSYDAFRVLIPTLRAEDSQFYITFNPDMVSDPVYDLFITHEREDSLKLFINYYDNPFLSDTMKKEIEYMLANNPEDFKWIYGGNCRETTEARILHNIVIHDFTPDDSRQRFYGMDHGFIDPAVVTECYIYDNELYVCNEFYKTNLDPEQLKQEMMYLTWAHGKHIIADSARPELNKMLNATGRFTIQGARKNVGQTQKIGAFKFTMSMYLKQFKKIHIHQSLCPNACREFPLWSFEVDKNENILDLICDKDDHSIDALIYSLERPASEWFRNNIQR
jgi:phage terminase large subunit